MGFGIPCHLFSAESADCFVPYGDDAASIRDSIGKTLSSEQLAEAQALATHYFEQYQPQ
jgi:hypothetical protein